MNSALHALWWRLKQQNVRDLAILLLGDAPWQTCCELDRRQLLGEDGLRILLALDDSPVVLLEYLAAYPTSRLGAYAEKLLEFWLDFAPHCQLVASNLVVRDAELTLGEYDFLAMVGGEALHIELTCKYYFMAGDKLSTLIGSNLRESWSAKQAKLNKQLSLAHTDFGRTALPANFAVARSVSLVRGNLFYRDQPCFDAPLSANQWFGWQRNITEDFPEETNESAWLILPRCHWLSPAKSRQTLDLASLREYLANSEAVNLVAECVWRPDNTWNEIARGMILPLSSNLLPWSRC